MEIKINSTPLDLELCELLGEKPSDFIIICLDGVPVEGFGTPIDSPSNRLERMALVEALNRRSKRSLWPKFWENWWPELCKQFALPIGTTSDQFRPLASLHVSRVCAGYSEHLHCAIRLFEVCADKIENWSVMQRHGAFVSVTDKEFRRFSHSDPIPSVAIALCFRDLLKANRKP